MPIKNLRTGVPVIGHAKIGQPGKPRDDGKQAAPEKFDHIELTSTVRNPAGQLVTDEDLLKTLVAHPDIKTCGGCERSRALGFEKGLPTRIPVQILYDDLELTLPHRLAAYRGRTAWCVGDGEKAERRSEKKEMQRGEEVIVFGDLAPFDGPCGDDRCPVFAAGRCKPHGRFRFMLGIQQSTGGCYEFRTTSWNSLANILESLKLIQGVTGGLLQGLPLYFEVTRQTVQPKNGPANTQTIARVIFPGSPKVLLEAARDMLQIRAPLMREIRALEASLDRDWKETPEEVAAIVREYLPDAPDGDVAEPAAEPAAAAAEEPKKPRLAAAPEPEDVEPVERGKPAEPKAAAGPGALWGQNAW